MCCILIHDTVAVSHKPPPPKILYETLVMCKYDTGQQELDAVRSSSSNCTQDQSSSSSATQIGGGALGGFIAGTLLTIVLAVVILLLVGWKWYDHFIVHYDSSITYVLHLVKILLGMDSYVFKLCIIIEPS